MTIKISIISVMTISGFLSLSSAVGEVESDDFSPEQMRHLWKREREINDAWSAKQDMLDRETATLRARLVDGDFSGIDEAATRKDLRLLWFLFSKANNRSIGVEALQKKLGDKPEFMPSLEALNKKVSDYIRPKIAAIPGHAKSEGDLIETMSQEMGYGHRRTGILNRLGQLGSMEAIQQLGRFLEDKRNPERGAMIQMMNSGMSPPESNYLSAAYAMVKALGDASPVKLSKIRSLSESDIRSLQTWWKSDASKPYREWTYDTGGFMPPPQTRPTAELSTKLPEPVVSVQTTAHDTLVKETGLKPWMFWVLMAAGVSLAVTIEPVINFWGRVKIA